MKSSICIRKQRKRGEPRGEQQNARRATEKRPPGNHPLYVHPSAALVAVLDACYHVGAHGRNCSSEMKEVKKMKIEITSSPEEIAALVLAVQERQPHVVNQLVLDTVHNTPSMESSVCQNDILAGDDAEDIK